MRPRELPDTCQVCNATRQTVGANWGRHLKRHPPDPPGSALNGSAPETALLPLKKPESTLPALEEFFETQHYILKPLAQAWRYCIDNMPTLELISDRVPDFFLKNDPPSPLLLPSQSCWVGGKGPVDEECLLDDIMHNYTKHTTTVYTRGIPDTPVQGKFASVILQLRRPSVEETYYCTNIPSPSAEMKVPEVLSYYLPEQMDQDIKTTINITPKYTQFDIHVDPLSEGITTTLFGCIKLWAFWPPTPENIKAYNKYGRSGNKFLHLYKELEHGLFAITTKETAVYIPPVYLHTTYTLEGGLTPGINYSSTQCIEAAPLAWAIERELPAAEIRAFYSTIETVVSIGLESWNHEIQNQARHLVCQSRDKFKADAKTITRLRNLARSKGSTHCLTCTKA